MCELHHARVICNATYRRLTYWNKTNKMATQGRASLLPIVDFKSLLIKLQIGHLNLPYFHIKLTLLILGPSSTGMATLLVSLTKQVNTISLTFWSKSASNSNRLLIFEVLSSMECFCSALVYLMIEHHWSKKHSSWNNESNKSIFELQNYSTVVLQCLTSFLQSGKLWWHVSKEKALAYIPELIGLHNWNLKGDPIPRTELPAEFCL